MKEKNSFFRRASSTIFSGAKSSMVGSSDSTKKETSERENFKAKGVKGAVSGVASVGETAGGDRETDSFLAKWGGAMILGGFLPAVFALIIIVSGQIIVNLKSGFCSTPLSSFISSAVAVSYVYLLVYCWIFIGDTVIVTVPIVDFTIKIFGPFTSLRWLMISYTLIGFASFIVWLVGGALLSSASLCKSTAPILYNYTLFLMSIYWMMFIALAINMVRLYYQDKLRNMINEQVRGPNLSQLEERVFKKAFAQFDPERNGTISHENVPKLLQAVGVYMPAKDIPGLIESLDPEQTGEITQDVILRWFKNMSSQADQKVKDLT